MTAPRPLLRPSLLVLVALATLAIGCSGDDKPFTGDDSTTTTVAPPPLDAGLVVLPPGFEPADTRGVVLTPLPTDEEEPSKEDLTIPVTDEVEGDVTINGRVTVDGRGAGARVRLERFVGNRFGVLDVDATGDGTFKVEHALGGRYRIRAWDSPDFSAIPSVTVFVPAKGDISVDVPMRRFEGPRIQVALDTAVPAVGSPVTLEALLTEQRVDDEGYLSGEGIGDGDLTLTVDNGIRIGSANPTSTDTDGSASWTVTCRSEGSHDITVEYEEIAVVVSLPACLPASEAPTTSSSSSSTTTTTPANGIAVGASFTPPYTGQLAAGRYESPDASACAVTYELRTGETWTAVEAPVTGNLVFPTPVRNVKAASGTTPCTYTRAA